MTFDEFVAGLVRPFEVDKKESTVDKNTLNLKVTSTYSEKLPAELPEKKETISLDGKRFSLETSGPLTAAVLAKLGTILEEVTFNGLLFYSLDPRFIRITGLTPLERHLAAFTTASGLSAGTKYQVALESYTVYPENPDLTQAAINSSYKKLPAILKSLPFDVRSEKIEKNDVIESNTAYFTHRPTLEEIEALERAFLKSLEDEKDNVPSSYSTDLVFRNPTIKSLDALAHYSWDSKGIYDGHLKHVVGRFGDVLLRQAFEKNIDEITKEKGEIGIHYSNFSRIYGSEPNAHFTIPHLQSWKKLSDTLGPVYVSITDAKK